LRMLGLDREPALGLDELASASASPEVRLELRRADGALRSLSTRRRVIWTLRVVEGETLPAIAEATGLSLATVKRELTVATEAVRAAVEEAP
ncbi:MAG: sigma-70 family RNA polymerase sigma factor, partial [Myxococcales bacterium]|nr:sigma-70 family RNA polymerase sigma factor [Myxococcales bacterium]